MAIQKISIQTFFQIEGQYPVFDVRSPAEYAHAHIPGASNLPLFSDEERKVVGTIYKKESKEKAIKTGLAFFGPKMVSLVEEAERVCLQLESSKRYSGDQPRLDVAGNIGPSDKDDTKRVIVHCWRGGMRSAGVAWLLDLYGFEVYTLSGGYKSFRRWCGQQFNKEYPFTILGGFTGSGKTRILQELKAGGNAILDLESLASHKGSVFGHLGEPLQPSQEMFENRLALALADTDGAGNIWLEDESQRIGNVNIPIGLFRYIQRRPVCFLEIPFEKRLYHIVAGYGNFEKDKLAEGIIRLKKRLGGLETQHALEFLDAGDLYNCFRILLGYYDKYYLKGLTGKGDIRRVVKKIPCPDTCSATNARNLLQQEKAEAC
jgi:tRNA 2-selenouridine synthase